MEELGADVCRRMQTYAGVCRRMLTYADVCSGMEELGYPIKSFPRYIWVRFATAENGWLGSDFPDAPLPEEYADKAYFARFSVYLIYWYKSTNTDAARGTSEKTQRLALRLPSERLR